MKSAGITCQRSVRTDDSMTRHYDGDRVFMIRHANGTSRAGFADGFCDVAVRACLSERNINQSAPNAHLERRTLEVQRKIKMSTLSFEVLRKLLDEDAVGLFVDDSILRNLRSKTDVR